MAAIALNVLKLINQIKWGILLYISAFLVFFIALFPYQTVKDPLLNKLSQITHLDISADQIFPTWNLSLIAQNLRIESHENNSLSYVIRQLKVQPSILGFFTKPVVNIDLIGIFGGNGLIKIQKDNPVMRFNMRFDDLELKKVPDLKLWFENNIPELNEIRAYLSGSILGNVIPNRTESIEGKINFTLRKVNIPAFLYNGFNFPELNFSQGLINIRLFKRKIEIEEIHLGTPTTDMEVIIRGTGMLNNMIRFSDLVLKIEIRLNEKIKTNTTINALSLLGESFFDSATSKYKIMLPISAGQFGTLSKF